MHAREETAMREKGYDNRESLIDIKKEYKDAGNALENNPTDENRTQFKEAKENLVSRNNSGRKEEVKREDQKMLNKGRSIE